MEIYSLNVEKHVLGGLINHPDVFSDIDRFVSEQCFYNEVHHTIFCVIRNIISSNQKLDKVLLAEKIKNLGISFKDEIDIFTYVDNLSFTQITKSATIESSKELLKYKIRREIAITANEVVSYVKKCGSKNIDEIISNCDAIYSDKIRNFITEEEPENLFANMTNLIEERGNTPTEDFGLATPYAEFNRMYGGLRAGNVYAIVSRPGQGKTTWINNICLKTAQKNNIKALMLDTEMSTEDIQFRMASAITDVPMWHLETGNWRKNPALVKKVRSSLKETKKYECYHCFVGNKNIDQICSLVRRWHLTHVGRGNKCLISYDYVKLTGEKVDRNWAEYQAIGDKIDKLKKLSEEVNAPLITAMQLNRSGENFNRSSGNVVDDSSAIALSDRMQWFASFVAIFRRKTVDEVALDGENFGTHKLIPTKTRFQGQFAAGHHDILRRRTEDGERLVNNYLNFSVENFDIEENGSLRHIIEAENEQYFVEDENPTDGELL